MICTMFKNWCMTGFIDEIITYPDLMIIVYHPDILQIFRYTSIFSGQF